MFTLDENRFPDLGRCTYKDGNGNSALFRRTPDGFHCRLRFSDPAATAAPLEVKCPLDKDFKGWHLDISFPTGRADEFRAVTLDFGNLVTHWVGLLDIVSYISADTNAIAAAGGGNPDTVSRLKMEKAMEYEELRPVIKQILGADAPEK